MRRPSWITRCWCADDAVSEHEKRPRGRPTVDEPTGSSVTAWLRPGEHDRLIEIAKREDKTISALVRELVKLKIGIPTD